MSFIKFLFFITLGGILFVAGPYVLLSMMLGLSDVIGIWCVPVAFVFVCWVVWIFITKLFHQ